MRFLQLMAGIVIWGAAGGLAAEAQTALPEHRYVYTADTDFYGADLGPLFDTTLEACVRACDAQSPCTAFTFNSRSNACFPKTDVIRAEFFEGAQSARKIVTSAAAQALASTRQAEVRFVQADDFAAARALVQSNAERHLAGGIALSDVDVALETAIARGDMVAAARWAGFAVALSDTGDSWARLAWLGVRPRANMPDDLARALKTDAVPAALNAYLRAGTAEAQVTALDLLSTALEQNERGRDMIAPLRLALSLEPGATLQATLESAIAKYGFRIVDTRVDNNSARPRICAEFSEPLTQTGLDYAPFVRVQDPTLAVEAQDSALCIEGVRHGARYAVTFRAGLPSASGDVLHKDLAVTLYVRDRAASVRFAGRAYVLPRGPDAALPVQTVNTDTVTLKLRRISDRNLLRAMQDNYFGKPLAQYEEEMFSGTIAQDIWSGTGDVQNTLNTEMTTRLPLGDALAGQPPGIYALSAGIDGADPYENPAATQWFILTDLGLGTLSGTDGLHANVRGLGDAQARAEVTLTLISRANAVLGEAVTDAQGRAHFPAGLTRGEGAAAPALLMALDPQGDAAFLSLSDPAFDLSDRGVEGRAPAPPVDTFLTTDRGAYRVGETIFATVLARDGQGRAIDGLPLVAVLSRPDGAEYSRTLSANAVAGGHVFALPVGLQAPRGAWRLDVIADPALGPLASQTVLVEDFLPDRIEFDLTLPDDLPALTDIPVAEIDARYLFGTPAANLAVEGEVRLRTTRTLEAHEGYLFGRHDTRFDTLTSYLEPAQTGAQGMARLPLTLPRLTERPDQPLELALVVRIAEGSGRPVERRLTRAIAPQGTLIGIKPGFDGVLTEGAEAQFNLIATIGDLPVRWTLNRIDTQYQWYQYGGAWAWEPLTRRIRTATGEMRLTPAPAPLVLPTQWGEYELVVEQTAAPYAVTSLLFSSGWYGGGDSAATPDFLAVTLDRDTYVIGETAQLRIVAPEAGVALIAVLSNRVIEQRSLTVKAGETVIPLSVTPDWGSGAYVTAALIRPMDAGAGLNPARSLGLAHARVAPGEKQLTVTLDAPAQVDGQAGSIAVPVTVRGIAAGETAYVTLAAVDVGILNLTGFDAPDPSAHYFGQRRLGVELRDVYGRLIDGLSGDMGRVRSGGDAVGATQLQSPPPTEALMAFFSGPVTVGEDGQAVIEVTRPAFNGTIRLMAVAWTPGAVGNAVQDITARDPVVITASVPRLLAPQDRSRLLLEFAHTTGPAGPMTLEVLASGGLDLGQVPAQVDVPEGGTMRLPLDLIAGAPGDHEITVALTTPTGDVLRRVLVMPVRANDPETAVTRRFTLGGGETFTFDADVLTGLRPGTASATLGAGPMARFDVAGLLRQLDRYPYGCTEQVTSAVLPLLYLSDIAQQAGLGSASQIAAKIDAGIALVLARQASNGGFGMWRADSGAFWLDAYVSDFLWRAQQQGFAVPDRVMASALDNLRNRINFAPDFDEGGEDIAYALLVLARAGVAQMGDLRYYADTKAQAFATPMAAAQLGAALAAYGDPVRADRMFVRAGDLLSLPPDEKEWRDDFGSLLRDRAAVLALAAEAGSSAVNLGALARELQVSGRTLSTQEAANVVLAAHAVGAAPALSGLEVDGQPVTGPVIRRLDGDDSTATLIRNTGSGPVDITLTTFGVPQTDPEAGGYGYALTRRYFTMEGAPVSGPVASGTRLVAVLEVQPFEEVGARLMIDDPLPAGFEIDNPNLLDSGAVKGLDWIRTVTPEMSEFRADRFLAAVEYRGAEAFQLAYVVRAVTPGEYHHPAALVTDMYRPEYSANTASGRLTVTP
jgi:uncharacterized protein YfaS (alpha-2-macroglobulin family)